VSAKKPELRESRLWGGKLREIVGHSPSPNAQSDWWKTGVSFERKGRKGLTARPRSSQRERKGGPF